MNRQTTLQVLADLAAAAIVSLGVAGLLFCSLAFLGFALPICMLGAAGAGVGNLWAASA